MALEKCTECGREVSTEAVACPGCGQPRPTKKAQTSYAIAFLAVVVIVLAGYCIFRTVWNNAQLDHQDYGHPRIKIESQKISY